MKPKRYYSIQFLCGNPRTKATHGPFPTVAKARAAAKRLFPEQQCAIMRYTLEEVKPHEVR